jgi:hypothetical protein
MKKYGFFEVLGYNPELVRGLALLGLGGSVGAFDRYRDIFQKHHLDFDVVIAGLETAQGSSGFPVVGHGEGKTFSFV